MGSCRATRAWHGQSLPALLLLGALLCARGYKVVVMPLAGATSHILNMNTLARELISRKHDVKVFAHHKDIKHFKGILESSLIRFGAKVESFFNVSVTSGGKMGPGKAPKVTEFKLLFTLGADTCDGLMADTDLEALKDVDLLLGEALWDCVGLVAGKLDKPYITLLPATVLDPLMTPWWRGSVRSVGITTNPAYIPQIGFGHDRPENLLQRLQNIYYYFSFSIDEYFRMSSITAALYKRHGVDYSSARHRARHVLTLLPIDPALEVARPYPPNVKLVGSIMTRPAQPLPQDFEDFISKQGSNGFLVAAFGSMTGTSPEEQKLLGEAFSALPVAVFWKLSKKELPDDAALKALNLAPNVMVSEWLPQNDLLGHPKARAFFTHCGANSYYESLTHGVPMIGRPGFADQPMLARRAEARGLGIDLGRTPLTVAQVTTAISKVLDDPSYKRNAEAVSVRLTARPRTPLQEAGDWVDHVLATNGSSYLRPEALDLPLGVSQNFDVMLAVAAALAAVLFALRAVARAFLGQARTDRQGRNTVVHVKAA